MDDCTGASIRVFELSIQMLELIKTERLKQMSIRKQASNGVIVENTQSITYLIENEYIISQNLKQKSNGRK